MHKNSLHENTSNMRKYSKSEIKPNITDKIIYD